MCRQWVTKSKSDSKQIHDYGVCSVGDGVKWYGELTDIIRVDYYHGCSVVLFKCNWYNTDSRKSKIKFEHGVTKIDTTSFWYKDDSYILATLAKKVFYVEEYGRTSRKKGWKVVWEVADRHGYSSDLWGDDSLDSVTESLEIPIVNDDDDPLLQVIDYELLAVDDADIHDGSFDGNEDIPDDTLDDYADDDIDSHSDSDSDDDDVDVDSGDEVD